LAHISESSRCNPQLCRIVLPKGDNIAPSISTRNFTPLKFS
jgi:hypothetical protein